MVCFAFLWRKPHRNKLVHLIFKNQHRVSEQTIPPNKSLAPSLGDNEPSILAKNTHPWACGFLPHYLGTRLYYQVKLYGISLVEGSSSFLTFDPFNRNHLLFTLGCVLPRFENIKRHYDSSIVRIQSSPSNSKTRYWSMPIITNTSDFSSAYA